MRPDQRALIETMLREGGWSTSDIAEAAGVSDRRISEERRRLGIPAPPPPPPPGVVPKTAEEVEEGDRTAEREQYERKLRKAIPVDMRVKTLRSLIGSKNPAIALRALELADSLSGYAAKDAALAPQTAPIFALPEGTVMKFSK